MPDYLSSGSYGLVGDGVADDYPAMQLFLDDLGNTGGLGILQPKKTYLMKTGTPKLRAASGVPSLHLYAHGALIKTDPATPYLSGLVVEHVLVTLVDEARKTIIEGYHVDHFENNTASYGIQVRNTTPHLILRDCMINAGANNQALKNQPNYQAVNLIQSGPVSGGIPLWNRIENLTIKGSYISMPYGIVLTGQVNDTIIQNSTFQNIVAGLVFQGDSQHNIANSVHLQRGVFEGVGTCVGIYMPSAQAGYTALSGFRAYVPRMEDCGTFFSYPLNVNPGSGGAPVIDGAIQYTTPTFVYNPNGLAVTVR